MDRFGALTLPSKSWLSFTDAPLSRLRIHLSIADVGGSSMRILYVKYVLRTPCLIPLFAWKPCEVLVSAHI